MKKLILLFFTVTYLLGMAGCDINKVDKTQPVFETESIKSITVYAMPDFEDGIPVPDEDMDEIISWIGTFRIDKKAGNEGDKLDPGTGMRTFRIEYLDGTIVESDANTVIIDEIIYYMKKDKEPECFHEIFARKRAENGDSVASTGYPSEEIQ